MIPLKCLVVMLNHMLHVILLSWQFYTRVSSKYPEANQIEGTLHSYSHILFFIVLLQYGYYKTSNCIKLLWAVFMPVITYITVATEKERDKN